MLTSIDNFHAADVSVSHRKLWWTSVLLIIFLCTFVSNSSVFGADCTGKYRAVLDRAFADKDIVALSRFINNENVIAECPVTWLDAIREKATQVVANVAEQQVLAGDVAGAEALLLGNAEADFALASYWSVNAVLGDIARERLQWQQAAQQYGEAYELAADDATLAASGHKRAEAIQLELFRLASESLRLSKDLSVSISRSGSGSGTLSSRGFKPVAIPLPVTFEFNSHQLSAEGLDQASLIANYVASQNLEQITFTGHTDWKGCAAYNQQLSERRASALAKAVTDALAGGPHASIAINARGLGENCPPLLSASGDYNDEQREDLARRVEISLNGEVVAVSPGVCDIQVIKKDGPEC